MITSTHHQAQYPYLLPKEDYRLIGWSEGISKFHQGGSEEELHLPDNKEAEIVYYRKINALGIQGHPESMYYNYHSSANTRKTIDYVRGLLDNLLEGKL